MTAPDTAVGRPLAPAARGGAVLAACVVLAAFNLRTAVTSIGPVLDEVQDGVGLSGAAAGLLTTLPVLSFALLGSLAPRLARRLGDRAALALALLVMAGGLLLRVLLPSPVPFLLLSVLALAGGAVGNVLLPGLVKREFPDRIGGLTAAYTTSMAVGTTVAAALTVPFADLRTPSDWRTGLASWSVPAALAGGVWLLLAARRRGSSAEVRGPQRLRVTGSRTAWAMALCFGANSLQAYVTFGWFALYYREEAGVSAARAGLLVAVLSALSIPISMVVPSVAARMRSQRPLVVLFIACYVVAYTGMLVAPRSGVWVEAVLAGVGAGAFPLALTMMGLRTRTPEATAALSAFAQSTGYALAGLGPVLVGVLHDATGGWGWPFVLLFADLAVLAVCGWYVAAPRYVEDDLA